MSIIKGKTVIKCDCCGKTLATRGVLFWRKDESFMTLPAEEHEHNTYRDIDRKYKKHYCCTCWRNIQFAAKKLIEEKEG